MSSSGAVAGLGLATAATWGGSDFVGGMGARRAPAMLVVVSGHVVSLLILLTICASLRLALPATHSLAYAALGGFEGSLALAVFYRALSMGAMGLTAAVTGLLTALLPVLFSLFHDGTPSPTAAAGLVTGLAAIWLITQTAGSGEARAPRTALVLGALAGIGFGTQLILFKMANEGGVLWTMTAARFAGALAMIVMLIVRPPKGRWKGFWLTGVTAGMLDTLGNLLYIRATQLGRIDAAALVSSLYPAGTILLAAIVLHERPTGKQLAGIGMALAAVVLLSV